MGFPHFSNDVFLASKTSPKRGNEASHIARPSLMEHLKNAELYPLTLVVSPAGYGKTVAVAQWLQQLKQKNGRYGWATLDESDNQAVNFAKYFTNALSAATDYTFADIAFQGDLMTYFSQLLAQLSQVRTPFFIVLDDYYHIQNSEIHQALRFWLKHQPPQMHLVILSRFTPPLSVTNLRLHEQVLEIGGNQLAFSLAETAQFIKLKWQTTLEDEALNWLHTQTQGWASGITLIALTAQRDHALLNTPEKLFLMLNQQHFADYMQEEVLHFIEPELALFMQRCAILHKMNAPLIEALTEDKNALQKLDTLEQFGLFIQRSVQENNEIWWKFHPMVAHYLSQRCRLTLPDEWLAFHKNAAQTWLKLGNGLEALYHAQILGEPDLIYTILQEYGWALFHRGQLKLLEESINLLPASQLWQDLNLVLLKAWLAQSQHRHQEVSGILQKFQPNAPLVESMQARFDALKAQVAINAGDEDQAYQLAKKALLHLSSDFGYARVVSNSIIGEAQHCRGDLKEGFAQMQKVERMALEQEAHHQWLWSKLQQAEILAAQGFLQSAYDLLKETMQQAQCLNQIPMHEFLLRLQGQILWEWHHLEQAEEMANAGIEVLENKSEQTYCLALLAKISLTKGDLNNAERLIEQCHSLISTHAVHQDWITTFDEVRILFWQMSNDKSSLESWLAQAVFPEQAYNHFLQRQWRNIARCYLLQGEFGKAITILDRLCQTATQHHLVSDMQRALILRNRVYFSAGKYDLAQKDLIQALQLSQQTNFISAFVIEGDLMAQQIRQLLQLNVLDELSNHKAQFILRSINQHNRHKFAHFDEVFVENLLKNPQVPELLKISPLTTREWQVLGLIYSGYSNEQISQELVVAITTIKTHIRNLYQKIGVANRNEAIDYTRNLLQMMGYNS